MKNLIVTCLVISIAMSGCVSLDAPDDPTRYYVLNGADDPESVARNPTNDGPIVRIAPVVLDPYLDTPYMVLRLKARELQFSDINRWAEDLGDNIRRALELDLMAGGEVSDVVTDSGVPADYVLSVHVHRFEGVPPDIAHLQSSWVLHDRDGEILHSSFHDDRNQGWVFENYGHLAEKLDESLMAMADAISERLSKM